MKRFSFLYVGALAGLVACLTPPTAFADDYDKKTVVTISAATEVPGIVLQPGTYVIKLLNSSSNRHITEIMNERMDHLYALTFTVAAERLTPTSKPVLTFYEQSNGRPQALRRWFWPSDTIGQEFIYPKDQAARISAASGEKVPEGNLPTVAESGQSLTPDNAKGLSAEISETRTKTDTDDHVAVAVETPAPVQAPPPVVAQVETSPQRREIAQVTPAPQVDQTPVAQTTAPTDTSERTLPQTASQLPLFAAIGIVCIVGAFLVGFIRRTSVS